MPSRFLPRSSYVNRNASPEEPRRWNDDVPESPLRLRLVVLRRLLSEIAEEDDVKAISADPLALHVRLRHEDHGIVANRADREVEERDERAHFRRQYSTASPRAPSIFRSNAKPSSAIIVGVAVFL